MTRTLVLVFAAATLIAGIVGSMRGGDAVGLPGDDEIHALLVDHVDHQQRSVGTVVGIITPGGRRILSYGHLDKGDPRPLDGDTVFEVGSITKIFTALLLADMVRRGEVALEDPVDRYLPTEVHPPQRDGRPIALIDLATHTSGLPFFPSDIPLTDPTAAGRAVAQYSVERMHRFLNGYEPPYDAGTRWTYSNLGYGLLGEALARRAGMDYETLLRLRVTGPLGLTRTAITLSLDMRARLAVGHDAALHTAPPVDMPAFLSAGSVRSTANDLLTLLAVCTGNTPSPLAASMALMLETRRPGPNVQQALGWWIVKSGPDDPGFVASGGQTPGFASTIAYDPTTRVGVVVLSNGTRDDGGLGWHLLRPSVPVATAESERVRAQRLATEIALPPELIDAYVGRYRVASGPTAGDVVTLERQGQVLILKSPTTSADGVRLHATDAHHFFLTEADVQVRVDTDDAGRGINLVFTALGTEAAAPRVDAVGSAK